MARLLPPSPPLLHCIREHLPGPDSTAQSRTEQESPAELTMKAVCLLRRRRQAFLDHKPNLRSDTVRNRLVSEIVVPVFMQVLAVFHEWFRECEDAVYVGVEHGLALRAGEVA